MRKKMLIILLLAVFTVYLSSIRYLWDDAVISYRFCQNLLLGRGIVSYDGGPPVEGYSNPSLVFLTAGIAKIIGVSDIYNLLRIGLYLNTLALLACCWLLLKWGEKDYTWISAFALILFFPIHIYRATGMETCLYMFFFTLSVYGFSEKKYQLGLAASLLTALSRPEGIGLALWLCTIYLFKPNEQVWRERLRKICLWLIIPFGLFLVWRYYYFGHLVSMSSLAKLPESQGPTSGSYYILKAITASPVLIGLGALTATRFLHSRTKSIYEITAIAFQVFFVVSVGSDYPWFERYRFIVPIFPILLRSIGIIPEAIKQLRFVTIPLLVILTGFFPTDFWYSSYKHIPWIEGLYNDARYMTFRDKTMAFLYPKPWHDEYFSMYLRDNVAESGKGKLLTSCQAGSLVLHWEGMFDDYAGLVSYKYAKVPWEKRIEIFKKNPPDIFAPFPEYQLSTPLENYSRLFTGLPILTDLYKMGYEPRLIFVQKFPPYNWRGEIHYIDRGCGFFVYTKDPDIIRIKNPSYYINVRFHSKEIAVPVIEVQIPS